MAKETFISKWKIHHTLKEGDVLVFEQFMNRRDRFNASVELLAQMDHDKARNDDGAEYEYVNKDDVESWRYECNKFVREISIYPVEIEKEEKEEQQ